MEGKWERLRQEMEGIRARQEYCVLLGDLNKLVGIGEWGVPGNKPGISLVGRLLGNLLETGNWMLVNGLGQDIVRGGPFTRKDPATGMESCLDLFVVSRELRPFVKNLYIDSDQRMAVGRVTRDGPNYHVVKSDHYTCILTLTNLPRVRETNKEKQIIWNLAKEGGWTRYQKLTEDYSETLEEIINDKDTDIEVKMKKFESIHDKIKFKAFGKVRISDKTSKNKKDAPPNRNTPEDTFKEQERTVDEEIKVIQKKNSQRLVISGR